jgi:hypothetical protein
MVCLWRYLATCLIWRVVVILALCCLAGVASAQNEWDEGEDEDKTEQTPPKGKKGKKKAEDDEIKIPPPSGKFPNQLINQVSKASVTITYGDGSGSGFFYKAADGFWLVSNGHVVGNVFDPTSLNIRDQNGKKIEVEPTCKADLLSDLAMFKLKEGFTPDSYIEAAKDVLVGEPILVLGNAKGDGIITPLEGVVKGLGSFNEVPIVEVSAPFVPGCSGGPAVNQKGDLVGVATYAMKPSEELKTDDLYKKTALAEARRMAVRTQNLDNAKVFDPKVLYLFYKASQDRRDLFELYVMIKRGKALSSVKGDLLTFLNAADKPVPNFPRFEGLRPSGMLNEYHEAHGFLTRMHTLKSNYDLTRVIASQYKQAERGFLEKIKTRKDSTFIDKEFHEAVDRFIERQMNALQ